MIDPEIRATVADLIQSLQTLPPETPVVLICHEDDGHHIDWEYATKDDIKYCIDTDENGALNIGFD